MRSQIDCYDDTLNSNFDLKTRAISSIRFANSEDFDLKPLNIYGSRHSFEREYYDLVRSSFLKYHFQARIGAMDGVFIAYHNTQVFLGFEYVKQEEVSTRIFGSTASADLYWDCTVKVADYILQKLLQRFGETPIRLTFASRKLGCMEIGVELMENEEKTLNLEAERNYVCMFTVETEIFYNEKPLLHLYLADPSDKLNVLISIVESPKKGEDIKKIFE